MAEDESTWFINEVLLPVRRDPGLIGSMSDELLMGAFDALLIEVAQNEVYADSARSRGVEPDAAVLDRTYGELREQLVGEMTRRNTGRA